MVENIAGKAGSKEFQNFYSSACHFALVLQLEKEELSTCPDQVFPSKDDRTSGFFGLYKGENAGYQSRLFIKEINGSFMHESRKML